MCIRPPARKLKGSNAESKADSSANLMTLAIGSSAALFTCDFRSEDSPNKFRLASEFKSSAVAILAFTFASAVEMLAATALKDSTFPMPCSTNLPAATFVISES